MKEDLCLKDPEKKIRELEEKLARTKAELHALQIEHLECAAILGNIPQFILIVDMERRIKKVSNSVLEYLGVPSEHLVGLRGGEALRCIHHLDDPRGCGFGANCRNCGLRNTINDTFISGKSHRQVEVSISLIDDLLDKRTFLLSAIPLDNDGERKVLVFLEDITERVKMERALKQSEERYRLLFHQTPLGVVLTDMKGRVVDVNKSFAQMLGTTREKLIGFSTINGIKNQGLLKAIHTALSGKTGSFRGKYTSVLSGKTIYLDVQTRGFFDNEGRMIGGIGIFKDISEKKQYEKLLRIQRDLAMDLSLAGKLDDALAQCLKYALKVDEVDCGGIYLVDSQNGDLHLKIHEGLPSNFVELAAFHEGYTPHAKLIGKGLPVYCSFDELMKSLNLSPEQIRIRESSGLRAVAVIPVKHEGKVIAAMNFGSRTRDTISGFARYSLEAIASQIAGTLARIESDQELEISRKNFQALFESLDDFLFVLDASGNMVKINPIVEKRLGYTTREIMGKHVLSVHPPEYREKASEIIRDMMEGKRIYCPIPLMKKDGSTIPVETRIALGTWNDEKAIFGISRDISDRLKAEEHIRQALKEKEILLREIHHRVKNNMQVVSSLLSLQAAKISDPEILTTFAETQGRVHSMSLVHEILYRSDHFTDIDAQVYLNNLSRRLCEVFSPAPPGPEIRIEAENVVLSTEHAIPCGLIVTELLTNSLKYAFPSKNDEKICLRTRYTGKNSIELTVKDNGIGIPEKFDPQHVKTLGIRLVAELVTDQLEGKWTLSTNNGVCWKITWPKA